MSEKLYVGQDLLYMAPPSRRRKIRATIKPSLITRIKLKASQLIVPKPLDAVKFSSDSQALVVRNLHYIAKINKLTGELTVQDPDQTQALIGDDFRINGYSSKGRDCSSGPTIEIALDFYTKIKAKYKIDIPDGTPVPPRLCIERTYEFTRSRNIYEQLELSSEGAKPVNLDSFSWEIKAARDGINATNTADDLMLSHPASLRHWEPVTIFARFRKEFKKQVMQHPTIHCVDKKTIVRDCCYQTEDSGIFGEDPNNPIIYGNRSLLINSIIRIGKANDQNPRSLNSSDFEAKCFQFYPDYGIILGYPQINNEFDASTWEERRRKGASFGEIDFLSYGDHTTPLMPVKMDRSEPIWQSQLDTLIRLSMFLRERIEEAIWWPKMAKNDAERWQYVHEKFHIKKEDYRNEYQDNEISACYSRSFPMMLYVWGLLTLQRRKDTNHWRYIGGDAGVIYETLQKLYHHYLPTTEGLPNFQNYWSDPTILVNAYYLGWCAGKKGQGVVNSHADAFHFACLMREASELRGDWNSEERWRFAVERYHSGNLAFFAQLHPASYRGKPFWGVFSYSLEDRKNMKHHYNSISLNGMGGGYELEGSADLHFIDAVERAYNWDYCPHREDGKRVHPVPNSDVGKDKAFVTRFCRLLPVCLTFVGKGATHYQEGYTNELCMHNVRAASTIRETLRYGEIRHRDGIAPSSHDPSQFIVEGDGRHWILTTGDFKCSWIPGFWEERLRDEIPVRWRFDADVSNPQVRLDGVREPRWTVSRRGDALHLMTNYIASRSRRGDYAWITFPVHNLKYRVSCLDFHSDSHNWGPMRVVQDWTERNWEPRPSQEAYVMVQITEQIFPKSLYIIDIESNDW
ncbi:MAG: hypothetical protein ACFFER_04125 [Candidatus Thorarchaeota archaeon]